MNRKTLLVVTVVVTVIFLAGSLFMSNTVLAAWTQPKGHAYNQLTWSYYVTKKKFTTVKTGYEVTETGVSDVITGTGGGVKRVETAKFTSEKITYYGEYGITDTLTIFTSIPWDRQFSDDTVQWAEERGPSGIGDINLGLRYNLSPNLAGSGVVMSLQGEVKIPEAYKYGNPLTHLSLGEGQYDTTLALLFGAGLGKGYAWLNAGYKYRFENEKYYAFKPSDQIKVSFGGGYAVTSWLSIRGLIDWTKSIGNASVSQELISASYSTGGEPRGQDNVLIRDTLGLESDALSAGVDLAFNITQQIQTVLSYTTDLDGIDIFETKDYSLGETFSLALVYMY